MEHDRNDRRRPSFWSDFLRSLGVFALVFFCLIGLWFLYMLLGLAIFGLQL